MHVYAEDVGEQESTTPFLEAGPKKAVRPSRTETDVMNEDEDKSADPTPFELARR